MDDDRGLHMIENTSTNDVERQFRSLSVDALEEDREYHILARKRRRFMKQHSTPSATSIWTSVWRSSDAGFSEARSRSPERSSKMARSQSSSYLQLGTQLDSADGRQSHGM
jgi:hypothetical protein